MIDTAAAALVKAQSGDDCFSGLEPEAQELAREHVRAVLRALWQPIETAPKDEKRVLVFGPDGVDIGRHMDWMGDGGEWIRDETAEYDNEGRSITEPTHWMPLPEPPQ